MDEKIIKVPIKRAWKSYLPPKKIISTTNPKGITRLFIVAKVSTLTLVEP